MRMLIKFYTYIIGANLCTLAAAFWDMDYMFAASAVLIVSAAGDLFGHIYAERGWR